MNALLIAFIIGSLAFVGIWAVTMEHAERDRSRAERADERRLLRELDRYERDSVNDLDERFWS